MGMPSGPGAVTIHRWERKGAPPGSPSAAAVANAVKRLRTLRHPYVLKLADSVESEEGVVLVTEPAVPLSAWLAYNREHRGADFEDAAVWGLYCLFSALSFLADDCKLVHGNLSVDTVWVTRGGDWKVGGFELCCAATPPDGSPFPDAAFLDAEPAGLCPPVARSPERAVREGGAMRGVPPAATDASRLGVLIADVFGGPLRNPSDVPTAPTSPPIPSTLRGVVARLLSASPRSRPTDFTAALSRCEYFKHPLVGALLFVDTLALKEPADKARFFKSLPTLLPRVPDAIAKYRLLPALMNALEYGAAGGGGTVVLAPILEIGGRLPPAEYATDIVPCVVRLFANNDRATRVQLLHHLPAYIDKLAADVVNTAVFPSIVNGFGDTTPVLREATVKACLHLAPVLTDANRNGVMCRELKRLAGDAEPGIRVNTVICLGRIAHTLRDPTVRDSAILATCLRSLRDPFPHARAAAVRALTHCVGLAPVGGGGAVAREGAGYFGAEALTSKVMPAASFMLLDAFNDAREAAFGLLEACVGVMRGVSVTLAAEAAEAERAAAAVRATSSDGAAGVGAGVGGSVGGGGDGAASSGAASAMAGMMVGAFGWAVSSIASRIIPPGEIGTAGGATPSGAGTPLPAAAAPATPTVVAPAPVPSPMRPAAATSAATGTGSATAAAARPMRLAAAPAPAPAPAGRGAGGWDDDAWDELTSKSASVVPPVSRLAAASLPPVAPTTRPPASGGGGGSGGVRGGWGAAGGDDDDDDDLLAPPRATRPAPAPAPARTPAPAPAPAPAPVRAAPAPAPGPAPAPAPARAPTRNKPADDDWDDKW